MDTIMKALQTRLRVLKKKARKKPTWDNETAVECLEDAIKNVKESYALSTPIEN